MSRFVGGDYAPKRYLDNEVASLSNEVARLRVMVQRVVAAQAQQPAMAARSAPAYFPASGPVSADGGGAIPSPFVGAATTGVAVPRRGDPLAVLPAIFAGEQGTKRLLGLLLDTYPWLRDAAEDRIKPVPPPQNTAAPDAAAATKSPAEYANTATSSPPAPSTAAAATTAKIGSLPSAAVAPLGGTQLPRSGSGAAVPLSLAGGSSGVGGTPTVVLVPTRKVTARSTLERLRKPNADTDSDDEQPAGAKKASAPASATTKPKDQFDF